MAADEEDNKEYRWETGYEKTWEVIEEDEEGLLESSVAEIIQKAKRKRLSERRGHIRLGMMRHLYLILDASEAMLDQDLKPTRQLCTAKLLEGFVEEFFDQNPISQMGVVVTKNKRADKISELGGNVQKHSSNIRSNFGLQPSQCSGEPSIQNALELALSSLRTLPRHASREVVAVMASLTTCDPGNISQTIASLKSSSVRVSIIGLAADVHVYSLLCRETGGDYSVVLDDRHLRDVLYAHVVPPPATAPAGADPASGAASLIKMGFPHHSWAGTTLLSMCMCHLESGGAGGSSSSASIDESGSTKLKSGGYFCPQCRSKYCELPAECRVCGLTLVSAPHLARSYHHLFPVKAYVQRDHQWTATSSCCFACQKKFAPATDKFVYGCPSCSQLFCVDCDLYIHDTLHTCPGCATNQETFQQMLDR